MDATEMELAGQIKKHRQALGISQEALAEKIHVSRQTISNWETARTYPDVQSLLLLSVAFDISIDELIGNHGRIRPQSRPQPYLDVCRRNATNRYCDSRLVLCA